MGCFRLHIDRLQLRFRTCLHRLWCGNAGSTAAFSSGTISRTQSQAFHGLDFVPVQSGCILKASAGYTLLIVGRIELGALLLCTLPQRSVSGVPDFRGSITYSLNLHLGGSRLTKMLVSCSLCGPCLLSKYLRDRCLHPPCSQGCLLNMGKLCIRCESPARQLHEVATSVEKTREETVTNENDRGEAIEYPIISRRTKDQDLPFISPGEVKKHDGVEGRRLCMRKPSHRPFMRGSIVLLCCRRLTCVFHRSHCRRQPRARLYELHPASPRRRGDHPRLRRPRLQLAVVDVPQSESLE